MPVEATTVTPSLTASPTPTPPATQPPTCAATGTPYCANQCIPCPTIRQGCPAVPCGRCIENPACSTDEVCARRDGGPPSGCCDCVTPTPGVTPEEPSPSPTEFFPACCVRNECPTLCGSTPTPTPTPKVYRLTEQSRYEAGCFPPCLCPLSTQLPVRGTFTLTPTGGDGLFDTFAVSNVHWMTIRIDGAPAVITGSGVYRIGGEVALQQQLQLDLDGEGAPVQHFDSGLVAAGDVHFPDIHSTVSINQMPCFDTVIRVDAVPTQPCIGDCNGDGRVSIDELITGVLVELGSSPVDACQAIACDVDLLVINCAVQAVDDALYGCGQLPAPTPTATPVP